ncbi:hypothetical protein MBLNU230_g6217t1 [Neophaeotheca triangularis]
MSGAPVSFDSHPPHGHPDNTSASTQKSDKPSTASHPPDTKPDPTTTEPHPKFHPPTGKTGTHADATLLDNAAQASNPSANHAAEAGQSAASAASSAQQPGAVDELSRLKVTLKKGLRQFPDFPSKGILFEDIMPLFASHTLHNSLIRALELQFDAAFGTGTGEQSKVDVVVGLESRGFLYGPTLALRLGAAFVPVRKQGKLPGEVATEGFKKEYGEDFFQIQKDAIRKGQKVVIVDDIIATGGSASAAGKLVKDLGGDLLGFSFLMELDFLKGREKLNAPVHTLLSGQESALNADLPLGRTQEDANSAPQSVGNAGGAAAETRP